ncbi:hypothetical protein ABGB17_11985 [Sphaerisporangium sp. B11E5]|uniref:hypothetical protein n=1 Tax=Sphaerisporangium sp. B11E5 TaxID=3153563 RepID=UPI00325F4B77
MSRVILVAILAVGAAAAGFPATRVSHASDGDDPRTSRIGVSVSRTDCPTGRSEVVMTAPRDRDAAEYTVHHDGKLIRNGILWPGVERTVPVYVDPGQTDRIGVTIEGQGTTTYQVRSTCSDSGYTEYRATSYRTEESSTSDDGSTHSSTYRHHHNPLIRTGPRYNPLIRDGSLPHTGPPTDFYGKVATALGLTALGTILLWLAMIWPRPVPNIHPHMTLRRLK